MFRLLSVLWNGLGILVALTLPVVAGGLGGAEMPASVRYALGLGAAGAYLVSAVTVRRVRHLPEPNLPAILVALVCILYVLGMLVAFGLGGTVPHGMLLLLAAAIIFFVGLWIVAIRRVVFVRYLVIPVGIGSELAEVNPIGLQLDTAVEPLSEEGVRAYDGVVYDDQAPLDRTWFDFVATCRFAQVPLRRAQEVHEAVTGRVSLRHLSEGFVERIPQYKIYDTVKRSLDLVGILVTLPIMIVLGSAAVIAIRIESPGRAVFSQERIGLGNRQFTLYKLRSMFNSAEEAGPRFAGEDDCRVTWVGAILRRFRIDEIPQIWNILRGEMSWIGPRPEQPRFVQEFDRQIAYYRYRHLVRPGISGWAQVRQGYAADVTSTRGKLEYDLYYLKHRSFWLDLLIAFKTLGAIVTGFGAR